VLVASETHTDVSCNGGSNGTATIGASGGTAPYGGDFGSHTGLAAGTYTYTVTDAHGCSSTVSVTIGQPAALVASESHTNVSCNGGSNGSATISASGGTSPYSGTGTFTGLAAGTYTYTVTDSHGCTSTVSVTITQPAVLAATAAGTNVSCNGAANGSALATVTGGTSPYSYTWNTSPVQHTNPATGLAPGTYSVTVVDANGCSTASNSVLITQPAAINTTTSKTNVTCFGGSNGTANLAVSGGTSPYTYLWSNGATTASISGLTSGNYTVTVTDAHGCTKTPPAVFVSQPAAVTVSVTVTFPSATANPSGGTPGYSYLWNTGATTQTITGLVHGNTYTVTVKDSRNCTGTGSTGVVRLASQATVENTQLDAQLFPNPTSGEFSLVFNGNENEHYTVILRDYTGRLVTEKSGVTAQGKNQLDFDLSSVAKGIYIISLERGSESGILRVVVQ